MKVFFDTNVLVDVLGKREPFWQSSARVWTLAERRVMTGMISAMSFTNVFHLIRRLDSLAAAKRSVRLLRDTFSMIACDEPVVAQAIDSGIQDFEDAIQFFSAMRAGATHLLTRNPSDYPRSGPEVLAPAEFLALRELGG